MGTRLRHLLLAWLLVTGPAAAIDEIHLRIADVEGPAWRAHDIDLNLRWIGPDTADLALAFTVSGLPEPLHRVRRVALRCKQARLGPDAVRCSGGNLRIDTAQLERPEMTVDFLYQRATGAIDFALKGVALAAGRVDVHGRLAGAGWELEVNGATLDLQRLAAVLGQESLFPPGIEGNGKVSFAAQLSGVGPDVAAARVRGDFKDLTFADAQWRKAGEEMAGAFEVNARADQRDWRLQGALSLERGELLVYPLYAETAGGPLRLRADVVWRQDEAGVRIDSLVATHPGMERVEASLALSTGDQLQVERAAVRVRQARVPVLLGSLVRPVLEGTAFADIESSGRLDLDLDYARQGPSSARLVLNDVYLDDRGGRYGVYGVQGELNWTDAPGGVGSHVMWQGGHVYKVTLGAGGAALHSEGRALRLAESLELPVFDGALQVNKLAAQGLGTPEVRWSFDGRLLPISVAAFSRAMDWPAMTGRISGVIPSVTYDRGVVGVDGALLVRAFDGDIVVHNMRLVQPFSAVPVLSADVDVVNIDLTTLTETFSFGKIEGRLGGAVKKLRMERWQPVAFDARFATPSGDRSRHRISQKAIDSLSSLGGGGAAGALSRSLLRFFEEFSYDRIGIGCRLRSGVCEMDGVAPAQGGYYLVKGGGLPRIDVIGFNRRIDWDVLLARLKAATQSSGAVIQ